MYWHWRVWGITSLMMWCGGISSVNQDVIIVLGIDNPTGLCLCRELSEQGVEVVGLFASRFSIGAASKHVSTAYRRANKDEWIEQLLGMAAKHKAKALLAVAENDIQWINLHRDQFSDVALLFPEQSTMDRVLDKAQTYRHAKALGIPVPETYEIETLEALAALRDELVFPVVVKWKEPVAIIPKLSALGVPLVKAEYVYSFEQLTQVLATYEPVGEFPLIQEYRKGVGLGQFFLIHDGQVLQRFQHQRIHEWPPEGGYSTVCRSLSQAEHQELSRLSEALLKALDWEGVAMVEYRYDEATKQAVMMEINGRFWGSFPLAYHANAGFAWRLYQAGVYGRGLPESQVTPGLECRFMVPETKRLLRVLLQPSKIKDRSYHKTPLGDLGRYLLSFVNPKTRYFVFMLTDAKPFFRDVKGMMTGVIKRFTRG